MATISAMDDKRIVLEGSAKPPVLVTTGQSQPTSDCRAHAASLATAPATHACVNDRQEFAAAMLGMFLAVTF